MAIWHGDPRDFPPGGEFPKPAPRSLTLAEVIAGAGRAAERVAKWPLWKREIEAAASPEGETD